MGLKRIILEPGNTYHIYNQSVGWDTIFREEENYRFFLSKLIPRISPFSDILSYCLIPNQFHFIIRLKEKEVLVNLFQDKMNLLKTKRIKINSEKTADNFLIDSVIINEFRNFFNSYVQAVNKVYRRYGSLLKESFQRKIVTSDTHLLKLICYVHNNPVAHGVTSQRENWKYSSYHDILHHRRSFVLIEDVLHLFEDAEKFTHVHDGFLRSGYGI